MMKLLKGGWLGWAVWMLAAAGGRAAAEPGNLVVVVYNSAMPESHKVAAHYAAMRGTPEVQVLGFDLPKAETMTRTEFREKLQKPLLTKLQAQKLLMFDRLNASNGLAGTFVSARIRYLAVCYGVPLRVAEDASLIEPEQESVQPQARRNGACVDAELTLLPSAGEDPLTGPALNPFYGATNPGALSPVNGVLLVGRLDGPDPIIASALVDRAMEAETNGLWGRAYFDWRSISNSTYTEGDNWIKYAAGVTRFYGFDEVVDERPETFGRDFPMSQIALYAGWYDTQVSGPFATPPVEFMPGAFAYHLYSGSAFSLRRQKDGNQSWCETFIADGATATMGSIDEPFLDGTPNVGVFFSRWLEGGASFGEAAFVSQHALSWQTTVVGDPLYRPFGKTPQAQHEGLLARDSDLVAWSFVRIVNVEQRLGSPLTNSIAWLQHEPWTMRSAVLSEKLGDLYAQASNQIAAGVAYRQALELHPTPRQRMRLEADLAQQQKKR